MRIQILLLLLSLLLPQLSTAAVLEKRDNFPQGATTNNPGAELWREVRQRDRAAAGTSQVKGVETGVLINEYGDRWARFRMESPVRHAPMVLGVVVLVIAVLYLIRGKVGVAGGLTGRMVKRFTDYERLVHWTLAILFLFLAFTGLVLLIGRPLLIPLLGKGAFSILASASKEGHNLLGPVFLVSLMMMLFSFARRNIYEKGDLTWLLKGGGLIGDGPASGGYFNMGEKTWYWMVILIGLMISISGLILLFPSLGQGRVIMALSHVVHVLGAIVLMAVSIGHMYMGSIGTEGTPEGMKTGYVDINWARAHHDRWAKQCHENDLVISAEEYARLQGKSMDPDDATTRGGN